jgi:hypothetical protein
MPQSMDAQVPNKNGKVFAYNLGTSSLIPQNISRLLIIHIHCKCYLNSCYMSWGIMTKSMSIHGQYTLFFFQIFFILCWLNP